MLAFFFWNECKEKTWTFSARTLNTLSWSILKNFDLHLEIINDKHHNRDLLILHEIIFDAYMFLYLKHEASMHFPSDKSAIVVVAVLLNILLWHTFEVKMLRRGP